MGRQKYNWGQTNTCTNVLLTESFSNVVKELCTQILKNECKKSATLKLFYILVMLHVYVLNVFLIGQRFLYF